MIKVAEISESVFRRHTAACNGKPTNRQNARRFVEMEALNHLSGTTIFESLKDHIFDLGVTDNYVYKLCQSIINTYLQIRFHHEAKHFTSEIRGTNIRNKLPKAILQKNSN